MGKAIMHYKEIENIDQLPQKYFLKCNDILFIGHRIDGLKNMNFKYFSEYFYDEQYDVFISKFKKDFYSRLNEILNIEKNKFVSSYVLCYDKKIEVPIKDYYNTNVKPLTQGILDKINKLQISKLKDYSIKSIFFFDNNEKWIGYYEI